MQCNWEGGPHPWNMCSLRFPTTRAKRQTPTCLAVIQLLNTVLAYLAAINTIAALAAIIILGLGHVVTRRDNRTQIRKGRMVRGEDEVGGWRLEVLQTRELG